MQVFCVTDEQQIKHAIRENNLKTVEEVTDFYKKPEVAAETVFRRNCKKYLQPESEPKSP